MSSRIHPKNVHENSPKEKNCPREVTKSVHENSPSENVHYNSPVLKKMSSRIQCPREIRHSIFTLMYASERRDNSTEEKCIRFLFPAEKIIPSSTVDLLQRRTACLGWNLVAAKENWIAYLSKDSFIACATIALCA